MEKYDVKTKGENLTKHDFCLFFVCVFALDSNSYLLANSKSGKSYQSTAYTAPEVPAGKYDTLDDVLTPIKR